jgi:DNA (cytosine-5)-methyltransferase 1
MFTAATARTHDDPKRGDIAPTCVAHYSKDLSTRLVADERFPRGERPYTVREYARLQGVPDTFTFAGGANDAYRMIGNGVSVPVVSGSVLRSNVISDNSFRGVLVQFENTPKALANSSPGLLQPWVWSLDI